MAKFTSQVNVGENVYRTWKAPAAVTDNDIGKPVKLAASDEVAMCADGDQIYGFIASVEPATADGKKVVSVLVSGRIWVRLDGNSAVGTVVEAAANEAAGTANASGHGVVSVHAAIDDTTGATILATMPKKMWMVVSGTGLNGANALIETV